MIEFFWTCSVCGQETFNEDEKQAHLNMAKSDPLHIMGKNEKERRSYIGNTPQLQELSSQGNYFCRSEHRKIYH